LLPIVGEKKGVEIKKFDFVVGQKVLILPEFGKEGVYPDTLEIGKTATVTSVVNSMSGEITLDNGGAYLAFSDEIEAVGANILDKQLMFSERIIEIDEYQHCDYHGEYPWECYYDDAEIVQMIDEQGFIDCPLCLAGMVGTE
jgi:hypothetical protein